MSDNGRTIDWSKTTFDGSRGEQLRLAQPMTLRERLEALDQLTELSERLQVMPDSVARQKSMCKRYNEKQFAEFKFLRCTCVG